MKNITEVHNIELLQRHVDDATRFIKQNPEMYAEDDAESVIIAETLVSSGAGQFAFREFREKYYTEPENEPLYTGEEDDRNIEMDDDSFIEKNFAEVAIEIKKIIRLEENFDVTIGFNENDGAIELYVVATLDDLKGDDL